jgi:hypothetical protein
MPVIDGFAPDTGTVGATVTISGSAFTDATDVTFDGTSATFTVDADTQITATVPVGATTGPIAIATPAGTTDSTTPFTVVDDTPAPSPATISGVSPLSGPVGTAVTVTGSGFTGATAVAFNGTPGSFTVDADTQITATVPTGAASGPVTVVAPGGTVASASSFDVLATPAVSTIAPTSGAIGATVAITGSALGGATDVRFNGTSASFTIDADTQITTWVPLGATSGPITVVAPGGTTQSGGPFTVVPPPTISGFAPNAGSAGSTVTITGSALAGASAVRFNGISAPFTVPDANHITAIVPVGATSGPISVTTAGGVATSPAAFSVTATLTVPPAADTYVSSAYPKKNFGTATTLLLNHKPRKDILLRFSVSGVGARTVLSAKLRLYCVHASPNGGSFSPVANTTWSETGVTWSTAPAAGTTVLATLGAVAASTWYPVDVTSLVRGDGAYSVRVTTPSTKEAQYVSKEGNSAFQPQLILTVA